MANIGDFVVYGTYSICEICSTESKTVAGKIFKYFVLKPVFDEKATVYVPLANNALLDKMLPPLSKTEVEKLIASIPQRESIWIENENERRNVYRQIISSGDRCELIKLIKTLHLHQAAQLQKGKKLHIADEKFLADAERILRDEFAFVLGVDRDSITSRIIAKIEK